MAVAAVVLAIMHIEGVGHYTRAAWKGYAWMGFSVVWLLVVAYVRVAHPLTLLKSPYRLTDVRQEHGSSWTLTVVPEGHAGFRFLPGQFAWLTLRSNPFRAKEHPFSFSGSAQDRSALCFTIKELGDFTSTIKDVRPGEIAYVDGPHGIFSIDHHPEAESFVFIAGGVGIAPIMSMLRTLADRGDPRRLRLIYGNWSWDSVLFREDLELLCSRLNLAVVHVLQEPPPEWGGLKGVLSESVMKMALPDAALSSIFFLCGPKPMSDVVQRTLSRRGVPVSRIQCELFDMA
jgi:predicted ferric reductase